MRQPSSPSPSSAPPPAGLLWPALIGAALAYMGALLVVADRGHGDWRWYLLPLIVAGATLALPFALSLARGQSTALMGYLALLIFFTEATFRTRYWGSDHIDWQVALRLAVWLGAGAIGLLNLKMAHLLRMPTVLVLALVAVMLISTTWSPTPLYSLAAAVTWGCVWLFGLALARRLSETEILTGVVLGLALLVLPSLLIWPFGTGITEVSPGSTGEADRLRGVLDHPIPLGVAGALLAALSLVLMGQERRGRRWRWGLLMAAGAVAVAASQSRIPALAALLAYLVVWARMRGGLGLLIPVAVLGIGGVVAVESSLGWHHLLPEALVRAISRSGNLTEVFSLSGRIHIWDYVLARIDEAPLFGHGFASGGEVMKGFHLWTLNHTHNAYLQALLYLGFFGAVPLALALIAQLWLFLTRPSPLRDVVLVYVLLQGVTEQSMLSNLPSLPVILWSISLGLAGAAYARRVRTPARAAPPAGGVPAGQRG